MLARMRFEEAHPSLFQGARNSRSWHEPSYPFMELTAVVPDFTIQCEAQLRSIPSHQWRWQSEFMTILLQWMRALRWQPEPSHVTFLELALDFEAYSRRSLSCSPGSELSGIALPLQERARVLRLALVILRRHVTTGMLFPWTFISRANALIPLGCGSHNGLSRRPYFSMPASMIVQLEKLQKYAESRWIHRTLRPSSSDRQTFILRPFRISNYTAQAQPAKRNERFAGMGGGHKKGTFASDYYRSLPPWTLIPRRRSLAVARPRLKFCVDHLLPVCSKCTKHGVRECCRRGHHRCRAHSRASCDCCQSTFVTPHRCCQQGHHNSPAFDATSDIMKCSPSPRRSVLPRKRPCPSSTYPNKRPRSPMPPRSDDTKRKRHSDAVDDDRCQACLVKRARHGQYKSDERHGQACRDNT